MMKKIAVVLIAAGLLSLGACSKSQKDDRKAKASPDPKLPARMEQQQKAINRAAEQMKREEEQRVAGARLPTPTPLASPP